MTIQLQKISRFPVKGLSADNPESVVVSPGAVIPWDRRYGLAHASSRVNKTEPEWVPKSEFLMLAKDEKLAQLGISFDEADETLSILRKGKQVSRGQLTSKTGRGVLENFLAAFLPDLPRGKPKLVEAPQGRSFSDVPSNWISIINLASVRDLERVLRQPVDADRFRGNLYIDGADPWSEFTWVNKKIQIGEATLHVEEPIGRCSATNVDPSTGVRDLNIPLTLQKGFGHMNCGIYAKLVEGGTLAIGDNVTL